MTYPYYEVELRHFTACTHWELWRVSRNERGSEHRHSVKTGMAANRQAALNEARLWRNSKHEATTNAHEFVRI